MEESAFTLKRTQRSYFHSLLAGATGGSSVDRESCAVISEKHAKSFGINHWISISSRNPDPTKNLKIRKINSVIHSSVEANVLLVKEDVYSSICHFLGLNFQLDTATITCMTHTDDYIPKLAASVKIAPILSACELSTEDDGTLLTTYFQWPRFVFVNDIFTVPLDMCQHLRKSAMYHNVTEVHFKVISVESSEPSSEVKESQLEGFYALKNYSDLYCLPSVSSYLPLKAGTVPFCGEPVPIVPPDLEKYVTKLKTLFMPFTKSPKPNCSPFFLLSGNQGSGKMMSLQLTANLMGFHLLTLHSYEFFGVGVSSVEAKLDYLFQKALKVGPCIVALTGFELVGKDKNGNEDARLVSLFLQRFSSALGKPTSFPLILIGLSDEKADDILPSVARAFVHSVKFQIPTAEEAVNTLIWLAKENSIELSEEGLIPLGKKVAGYVHADLVLLMNHAIRIMNVEECLGNQLNSEHLERGIELMESAYSDGIGAAKVPSVRWDDVGGLKALKEEVMFTLNMPMQRPGLLAGGLRRSGILFYGPPGTGKTLMAKAVATECSMNFLSVKGPELMNMYVGQSERNVREVFERGREATPCILFFDELDSLAPNRGKSGDSGGVTDRVVSQLLAEMDGLQSNKGLFVIAATNRPDLVDPALLRPGRFDKMFYLGPCADADSKLSVLQALSNKFVLSSDVDLEQIVDLLPIYVTGADVYSVCSNAWLSAARRYVSDAQKGNTTSLPLEVSKADFESGVREMVPSLTTKDLQYYEQLAGSLAQR